MNEMRMSLERQREQIDRQVAEAEESVRRQRAWIEEQQRVGREVNGAEALLKIYEKTLATALSCRILAERSRDVLGAVVVGALAPLVCL